MKIRMCSLAASLALISTASSAAVYDISATDTSNLWNLGGGIFANGFTLTNSSSGTLTYIVTPVDGSISDPGAFTAANRFNVVDLPGRGWEWNYWVEIGGGSAKQIGFGGGIGDANASTPPPRNGDNGGVPAVGGETAGNYKSTAGAAFATAPTYSFSLAAGQSAKLYWRDDIWTDNAGGISVNVAVVPEPEAYGLALAGMGVVAFALRRRRATA